MPIFALVDCNNFYASCERAFNPKLENKPVVVLSNNDGCVIARSNEAKLLGIPMGAPYYKYKPICFKNNVHVFSSNYELYGDMSERVMSTLRHLCPDIEIYSIDEAFLQLDGFKHKNLEQFALEIKQTVKTWTGIPVSIGFAPTKTLAKVANKIAKKQNLSGVFDLTSPERQEKILSTYSIEDIWGISHKLKEKLNNLNIHTALDLRNSDPRALRKQFSVVIERMIYELRGISCLPLESVQPRKQIMCSRSFGKLVTDLNDLEEAISSYAARACLKLRNQQCITHGIYVFIRTNIFSVRDKQYGNSICIPFPEGTDDTSLVTHYAKKCIRQLFKKGYKYHKVGIMLLNLAPNTVRQLSLFNGEDLRKKRLINTVDKINRLLGKNSIYLCAEGIKKSWQIKRNFKSPCYTTKLKELMIVCA